MPTRPPPKPTTAVATDVEDFVAPETPARSRTLPRRQFERLLSETNALKEQQAWQSLTPKHFVALYCLLHRHVYGVVPEEVRDGYRLAVGAANRMLRNEFNGDQHAMVEFVRWVWQREQRRAKQREHDYRMGWRLQFGRPLLTDYRVARARAGKRVQ